MITVAETLHSSHSSLGRRSAKTHAHRVSLNKASSASQHASNQSGKSQRVRVARKLFIGIECVRLTPKVAKRDAVFLRAVETPGL